MYSGVNAWHSHLKSAVFVRPLRVVFFCQRKIFKHYIAPANVAMSGYGALKEPLPDGNIKPEKGREK